MATEEQSQVEQNNTFDPGYLMLVIYLLSVTVLVLFGWCGSADAVINGEQITGKDAFNEKSITLDDIRQGELLLPGRETGRYRAAPMLSMDVDIKVSGIVARTTIKQHFKNNGNDWVEALYVFPLPDESAVDHMQMQINDRVIVGEIKKKKEARKTYEAAKKAGKKTSLLSQQRPNMFTTSVANVGPNETVIIEIEYQQIIQRQDNIFSLRFPMVVGPRYQPGACPSPDPATIFSNPANKGGDRDAIITEHAQSAQPASTISMDSVFSPAVAPDEKPVNPVSLRLNLAAGMELSRLDSLYHGVTSSVKSDNSIDVQFNGEVKADRDFVLEWEPKKKQAPQVTLFSEQKGEDNYMLLMVMPPEQQIEQPLARETVFILDTSGSMGGASIRQAKKALLLAVATMRPQDRFNVIEFNSRASSLFSTSKSGNPDNLQRAVSFIEQLEANGGTEIKPALELALDGRQNHERIRQVVFLTDGCVSNEEELFTLINQHLGDSRLFTVGIGSAPNSYFMTRAAAMGRGSYTYIGKLDEVQEKMTALFTMLEQPAITDLQLTGVDIVETLPTPLPDLYQREPLVVVMKSRGAAQKQDLLLAGLRAGITPWQVKVDSATFLDRPGIAVLWARKKIRILSDSLSSGADPDKVKQEVTELALANHLVSRYTSLVAVEQIVSRPEDVALQTNRVKNNLPAGWQQGNNPNNTNSKIFAGSASSATPASFLLISGLIMMIISGLLALLQRRVRLL